MEMHEDSQRLLELALRMEGKWSNAKCNAATSITLLGIGVLRHEWVRALREVLGGGTTKSRQGGVDLRAAVPARLLGLDVPV